MPAYLTHRLASVEAKNKIDDDTGGTDSGERIGAQRLSYDDRVCQRIK